MRLKFGPWLHSFDAPLTLLRRSAVALGVGRGGYLRGYAGGVTVRASGTRDSGGAADASERVNAREIVMKAPMFKRVAFIQSVLL